MPVIRRSLLILIFCLGLSAWADPVAKWGFGQEETTPLMEHGGVHRDQPGPRPPTFPDFDPGNLAVKFDGSGAHFSFADPGPLSPFDFTNGDAITLEAWVNVADVHAGENVYVIGKGRTYAPGYPKDNQNWALRLREVGGAARISFLFATPAEKGEAKDAHWHRWTTAVGFAADSGWHHVAVAYKFGSPESVRGWIDGQPVDGAWDMGGPTKAAPIVDDDAIWIGSSMGGSPANSFRGLLDEIAIHREILTDDVIKSRFRRDGPAVALIGGSGKATPTTLPATRPARELMPNVADVPQGKVLFTFHEGLAAHDRWWIEGEKEPAEIARWTSDEMLLPRLPQRYDSWGIRDSWKSPVLVRATADVSLPPGNARVLLRARGLSRLWVNGKVVARLKPPSGGSDGHHPVTPVPTPPMPGLHGLAYGDQETFGEFEVPADGKCRVILESIAGTKKARPEPGETFVAIQTQDGQSLSLLGSAAALIEESAWPDLLARTEKSLATLDKTTRQQLASSQDTFWQHRHEAAVKWVADHSAPAIPSVKDATATNPIDAFLASKREKALAASAGNSGEEAKKFHTEILPVLATTASAATAKSRRAASSSTPATPPSKPVSPATPPSSPAIPRLAN